MKKYLSLFFLSLFLIACSKTSDQEYLTQAEKSLKEKNIDQAVTDLESLVKEYPESELSPKALVQLAGIFQNQLVKNLKPTESLDRAQKYYLQVYEKYPESEEAPKSLFMAGYILANDLQKFDDATKNYNLFLQKYPSHPLAVSAKEELDNMGLSPEEILKRTETAKQ